MRDFKVGDKVKVKLEVLLPYGISKKIKVFTIVVVEEHTVVIDTVIDGWTRPSIGNSYYWHMPKENIELYKVPKNIVGGKIL